MDLRKPPGSGARGPARAGLRLYIIMFPRKHPPGPNQLPVFTYLLVLDELHLLERRAAQYAVRVGERFRHLEVVVALGDDELDGFAGRPHGRREVPGLPLELGRIERAVADYQWRVELVQMALPPKGQNTTPRCQDQPL